MKNLPDYNIFLNRVPEIVLENWKGLSNSIVSELKTQLLKEAAGYVGEVNLSIK